MGKTYIIGHGMPTKSILGAETGSRQKLYVGCQSYEYVGYYVDATDQ